jgi:hypothetical protein
VDPAPAQPKGGVPQAVTLQRHQVLDQAWISRNTEPGKENSSYLGRRLLNTLPTAKEVCFYTPRVN